MHEKQFSALTGVRASIWSGIPPALLLLPVCLRATGVCLPPFFSASRSSGTDASEDEGKALQQGVHKMEREIEVAQESEESI